MSSLSLSRLSKKKSESASQGFQVPEKHHLSRGWLWNELEKLPFNVNIIINMIKVKKDARFKCSFCEKTFNLKRNFQEHERTHTGEKPFSCSKCDKKFAQSRNLKNHEATHSSVKTFKCSQ